MSGEAPILELKNFGYTYLEGTPRASEAIRAVSLTISPGERVGIVGPTQSGKSTVADAFAYLLRLKRGQVFYDGEDVAAPGFDRSRLRREVGLDVPLAASLAGRLRARGVPLRGDILTDEDLRASLSALTGHPAPAEPPR